MSGKGYNKRYAIKLADHGRTVVVHGCPEDVKNISRDMRHINNKGCFSKADIIKTKGVPLDRLMKTFGIKDFNLLFYVQAEYLPEKEQYLIVRSSNKNLPVGKPLMFSAPPLNIRFKKIKKIVG